ncbi:hypothetical protein CHU98_g3830 [Xylaria longipes]|nr:hypothetical protein CHU98_g3830 [Xylaria longipes]
MNDLSPSGLNEYSTAKWIVPDSAWNFSRPLNATNLTWVDASEIKGINNEPLHASLTVVAIVPVGYTSTSSGGAKFLRQGSMVSPCVIDARWATTNVTFDTGDNILTTDLTVWLNTADFLSGHVDLKAALSQWDISDPISLSANWARIINSPIRIIEPNNKYSGLRLIESLLQEFVVETEFDGDVIVEFFPTSGKELRKDTSNDIAILLATRSSDAVGTTPLAAFENQTPIVFDVQRHGYGYGLNSDTIWFSVVTLLIHVLLVLVYFCYSFIFWCRARGWTSNGWGTIGEFLALAVVSPSADELRNSGAGVNRSRAWMTPLRIRERSENPEKLELVVGDRDKTVVPTANRVKVGKEYA